MQDIQAYLSTVYRKLKNYYTGHPEERDGFAARIEEHLRNGVGVYEIPYVYVYVLRYALAYGFEYSRIYKAILDVQARDTISVTSIGAGTGIDYWGLRYAIEKLCRCQMRVTYTGVEPDEDWRECRLDAGEGDTFDFPQDIRTFGELLRKLQDDDLPLSDVYLFPKSVKEVGMFTVPENGPDPGYEYNTLQSMADFGALIRKKITDRPVFIAFAYRTWPGTRGGIYGRTGESDEFRLRDELAQAEGTRITPREIFDTVYGTYLISTLRSSGLQCEMVPCTDPALHTYLKGSANASYDTYYLDEQSVSYYSGKYDPKYDPKKENSTVRIYNYDHTFDSPIRYSESSRYGLIDKVEWNRYSEKAPITGTDNICFQIFRISKRKDRDPWEDRIDDKLAQKASLFREHLRTLEYPTNGESMYVSLADLYEKIRDACGSGLSTLMSFDHLTGALKKEGLLDQGDMPTEKGKHFGYLIREDELTLLPFAQKVLVANVMNGKYLDRSLLKD